MNGTVVGTLLGGLLLFLSSLLVPVISKRVNKATDAADSAQKLSASAVALASGFQERIEATEDRCNECLAELKIAIGRADAAERRADAAERRADSAERRADRNDRTNSALIDAWTEAIPLLDADNEATKFLRATVRAARQARYENE